MQSPQNFCLLFASTYTTYAKQIIEKGALPRRNPHRDLRPAAFGAGHHLLLQERAQERNRRRLPQPPVHAQGQEPLVRDPDEQGLRAQDRHRRRQEAQGSRLQAFTRERERDRLVRLPLQKTRAPRPEGAARIHAVVDAARDFSAKHAFRISADTVREIVGLHYDAIRDFPKDESHAKEDAGGAAPLVCVMADGTGIPLRKECLKGAKGKDGRAKTREVKAAAIFRALTTSDNEPHRDIGTTSYVATTHRTEKFGKLVRAEFDRRFGQIPETTLYITDGGKWLQTVWRTSTTGPTSAA